MTGSTNFDHVIDSILRFSDKLREITPTPVQSSKSPKERTTECSHCPNKPTRGRSTCGGWKPFKDILHNDLPKADGIYLIKWNCKLHVKGFYNTIGIKPGARVESKILNKLAYLGINGATNTILYIGKTNGKCGLCGRLRAYWNTAQVLNNSKFFLLPKPSCVSHWGGRYVWALQDNGGNSAFDMVYYRCIPTSVLINWWAARGPKMGIPRNLRPRNAKSFEHWLLMIARKSVDGRKYTLPLANLKG